MRVLIACEESGRVRDAFLSMGHDAWSCDLLPTSGGNPVRHLQCDVLRVLDYDWDMVIGFPPCTYQCNSGVRWLKNADGSINQDRFANMVAANRFFNALLNCRAKRVAVENPIPHGFNEIPKYTQIIQPWHFGDNFTKATCLWLRGLPQLVPEVTQKPESVEAYCHKLPPGPDRAILRSKTYPGIARAMAEQWG